MSDIKAILTVDTENGKTAVTGFVDHAKTEFSSLQQFSQDAINQISTNIVQALSNSAQSLNNPFEVTKNSISIFSESLKTVAQDSRESLGIIKQEASQMLVGFEDLEKTKKAIDDFIKNVAEKVTSVIDDFQRLGKSFGLIFSVEDIDDSKLIDFIRKQGEKNKEFPDQTEKNLEIPDIRDSIEGTQKNVKNLDELIFGVIGSIACLASEFAKLGPVPGMLITFVQGLHSIFFSDHLVDAVAGGTQAIYTLGLAILGVNPAILITTTALSGIWTAWKVGEANASTWGEAISSPFLEGQKNATEFSNTFTQIWSNVNSSLKTTSTSELATDLQSVEGQINELESGMKEAFLMLDHINNYSKINPYSDLLTGQGNVIRNEIVTLSEEIKKREVIATKLKDEIHLRERMAEIEAQTNQPEIKPQRQEEEIKIEYADMTDVIERVTKWVEETIRLNQETENVEESFKDLKAETGDFDVEFDIDWDSVTADYDEMVRKKNQKLFAEDLVNFVKEFDDEFTEIFGKEAASTISGFVGLFKKAEGDLDTLWDDHWAGVAGLAINALGQMGVGSEKAMSVIGNSFVKLHAIIDDSGGSITKAWDKQWAHMAGIALNALGELGIGGEKAMSVIGNSFGQLQAVVDKESGSLTMAWKNHWQEIVGIGLSALQQLTGGTNDAINVMSSTISGAMAGAKFGPWGAAIGGVMGFASSLSGGGMTDPELVTATAKKYAQQFGITYTEELDQIIAKASERYRDALGKGFATAGAFDPSTLKYVLEQYSSFGHDIQNTLTKYARDGIGNLINALGQSPKEAFTEMQPVIEGAIAKALEFGQTLSPEMMRLVEEAKNLGVEIKVSEEAFEGAMQTLIDKSIFSGEQFDNLRTLAQQVGIDFDTIFREQIGSAIDSAFSNMEFGDSFVALVQQAQQLGIDVGVKFNESLTSMLSAEELPVDGLQGLIDAAKQTGVALEVTADQFSGAMENFIHQTNISADGFKALSNLAAETGHDIDDVFSNVLTNFIEEEDFAIEKLEGIAKAAYDAGIDVKSGLQVAWDSAHSEVLELKEELAGFGTQTVDWFLKKFELREKEKQYKKDFISNRTDDKVEEWREKNKEKFDGLEDIEDEDERKTARIDLEKEESLVRKQEEEKANLKFNRLSGIADKVKDKLDGQHDQKDIRKMVMTKNLTEEEKKVVLELIKQKQERVAHREEMKKQRAAQKQIREQMKLQRNTMRGIKDLIQKINDGLFDTQEAMPDTTAYQDGMIAVDGEMDSILGKVTAMHTMWMEMVKTGFKNDDDTDPGAAMGGVITQGTYKVGELGPEFVMRNTALNKYGVDFMRMINEGRYAPQAMPIPMPIAPCPIMPPVVMPQHPGAQRVEVVLRKEGDTTLKVLCRHNDRDIGEAITYEIVNDKIRPLLEEGGRLRTQ